MVIFSPERFASIVSSRTNVILIDATNFISCNKQITPSLSDTSLSLTVVKRYNRMLNDKLEGSSYYCGLDNEAVAKVNESNGYVLRHRCR